MWCDTCETSVQAPSGICVDCGEDLLGYGQPMALATFTCLLCKKNEAMGMCDVCEDCYNVVSGSDPDAFPEVCQSCCSIILTAGQVMCSDCSLDYEVSGTGKYSSRGYDWWTGEEIEVVIPSVEQELELIPALRKA